MDTLLRDFRHSLRTLLKNPAFTLVIVVTLALGIGANTAMFSVVNTILLQPLPYKDSGRLVSLWTTSKNGQRSSTAFPDFREIRERNRSFDSVAAYTRRLVNVRGTQYPQRFRALVVSPEFLSTLDVQPRLGRDFRTEEGEYGSNNRVVIITDSMWRSSFGSDPQIVGRNIILDAQPYTIVGVLPPDFWFLDFTDQLMLPLSVPPALNNRANHYLNMIGRLRPGVSREIAAHDLTRIATTTGEIYSLNKGMGFQLALLQQEVTRNVRNAVLVLMAAVGFVLLIACGNLASLFVARCVVRKKETAVRVALGAKPGDLFRKFLTESILLCLVGGFVGVFTAFFITRLIRSVNVATLPRSGHVHIDLVVLLFALCASLVTAIVFGVVPWIASRTNVQEALKEGGHSSSEGTTQYRLRASLVVGEVALAVVLLAGAGLMIKSVQLLRAVNSGFDDNSVLIFTVSLPAEKYSEARLSWFPAATQKANAFVQQATDRIGRLHGVRAVGVTTTLPLSGISWDKVVTFYDRPLPSAMEQLPQIEYRPVAGDYFRALGIRLISGRVFDAHDSLQSLPVAVVNQELVRRYMKGENPIGKQIAVNPPRALLPATGVAEDYPKEPEKFTIIGVVGNARYASLQQDPGPMVYAPYSQNAEGSVALSFAIRTDSDPSAVVNGVRQQIAELDKDLPLGAVTTMGRVVSDQIATPLTEMFVLGAFGGLAMLLASVGVYGIMSYSIAQRTREIGIRMALGAHPIDVMRLVMRQGLSFTLVGLALGLAGALLLTKVMKSMIYGIRATDPGVFLATGMLLAVTAVVAMFFPACRATRINPVAALRNE